MIERVVEKFADLVGEPFYQQYKERIIFAISVHSIACWLLPLYYQRKKEAAAIKDCSERLNRQLRKQNIVIPAKTRNDYDRISRKYCSHKTLMSAYAKNPSLKIFIEEIQRRDIVIEEEDDWPMFQ